MLPDDGVVADLPITESELVVDEPDGLRIVRELSLFECAAVKCNCARLVATRKSNSPVKSPERGERRGRDRIAQRIGGAAEDRTRLVHIVAHEAGFRHCAAECQLVVSSQRGRAKSLFEDGGRLGGTSAFKGGARLRESGLKCDAHHGPKYTAGRYCRRGHLRACAKI